MSYNRLAITGDEQRREVNAKIVSPLYYHALYFSFLADFCKLAWAHLCDATKQKKKPCLNARNSMH